MYVCVSSHLACNSLVSPLKAYYLVLLPNMDKCLMQPYTYVCDLAGNHGDKNGFEALHVLIVIMLTCMTVFLCRWLIGLNRV